MDADRVYGRATRKIQSRRRQIERERTHLDQERQHLLDKQSELRGRIEKGVAIGALADLEARIKSQLQDLEKKYTLLNHAEADLRRKERDIDLQLGACPAGHTPSSSRETRSTGSTTHVRQSVLYSAPRGPRSRKGRQVEEHTGEVSSSELEHTSTDVSQFDALPLNTTPPTLKSADRSTGSTTHVRQSVLYSVRRGPRGRKGRPVEEHTGEVSSSELEHTSTDLSQFDTLPLISTLPTLKSVDRVEEHSTEVRSSEHGGTSAYLSKVEGISLNVTSPAYEPTDWAVVHASGTDSTAPDSTIAKQPAVQEALSPRSEERRQKINQYLAEHTFDDVLEAMVAVKNGFCNPPKKVSYPSKKSSEKLALPDSPESPHRLDAQSFQTKIQCGVSTKQIIKNGKLWMEKEVMKVFKKCIIEREGLRGVEFELDELLHQCFSVETYEKIFHHYNFTVKMKKAGSDKWSSSTLYFAQVKEMYGQKFYFCYPLDPNEDGICYACKNQGMYALRHPAVPIGYETGQPDAGCPFVDDDSDDDCSVKLDNDAFVWAFEQVFCKGARS